MRGIPSVATARLGRTSRARSRRLSLNAIVSRHNLPPLAGTNGYVGPDEEKELHNLYTNVSRQGTPSNDSHKSAQLEKEGGKSANSNSEGVPDIEKERERNMQRNQDLITSLGLDTSPGVPPRKPTSKPRPRPKASGQKTTQQPTTDRELRGR